MEPHWLRSNDGAIWVKILVDTADLEDVILAKRPFKHESRLV